MTLTSVNFLSLSMCLKVVEDKCRELYGTQVSLATSVVLLKKKNLAQSKPRITLIFKDYGFILFFSNNSFYSS